MKKIFLSITLSVLVVFAHAQHKDVELAMKLVNANSTELGMTPDDIANSKVSDTYYNESTGAQMVYLQQNYLGLPVHNQLQVLAFKNGKLVSAAGERIAGMPSKAGLSAIPSIAPEQAVKTVMNAKNVMSTVPFKATAISATHFNFGKMGVSREEITAQLIWAKEKSGKMVKLAWQVYLVPTTTSDYFQIRVDAITGSILDEDNFTVYCNIPHREDVAKNDHSGHETALVMEDRQPLSPNLINTANYRVIPFPAESRLHPGGTPALVTNPWLLAPEGRRRLG